MPNVNFSVKRYRAMRADSSLRLAGITPFTTIDFPGHLAAVLFLQGCPWRCSYCHNPQMQSRQAPQRGPTWETTLAWLQERRGLLDGVAFSGGEPLLQPALPTALQAVRELGFATALHTGGAWPQRLATVLPDLDWVGFDFKAPFDAYPLITGIPGSGGRAETALRKLQSSGVTFEIRTTIDADLHSLPMLEQMNSWLWRAGIGNWYLQPRRLPDGRSCPRARTLTRQALAHFPQSQSRGLD